MDIEKVKARFEGILKAMIEHGEFDCSPGGNLHGVGNYICAIYEMTDLINAGKMTKMESFELSIRFMDTDLLVSWLMSQGIKGCIVDVENGAVFRVRFGDDDQDVILRETGLTLEQYDRRDLGQKGTKSAWAYCPKPEAEADPMAARKARLN